MSRMPRLPSPTTLLALARRELGVLAVLGLGAALLLAFLQIADEVVEGETDAFDRAVFLLFRDAADPARPLGPAWLPEMMRDVTALGSTVVLAAVVLIVVGYLLMMRMRGAAVLVLVSVIGGQLLSTVLKIGFDRARPDLVPGAPEVFTASFPSGHAMLSAVTYLTLGALLSRLDRRRRFKAYVLGVSVLLAGAIGVSRVYLGVHWPTDVLAGWSLGAAWAMACWLVAALLQRRGDIESSPAVEAGTSAPDGGR